MKNFVITTSTYIGLTLAIFGFLLFFFLMPREYTAFTQNDTCVLGSPPSSNARLSQLPVTDSFGPSTTKKTDYVQVRANVPTSDSVGFFKKPDLFLEPSQDDAHLIEVDHDPSTPDIIDENPQKPGFDEFYPYGGADGKVYPEWEFAYSNGGFNIIDLGLIFYRNKDPKSIIDVPSKDPNVTYHIYSVDIYQDVTKIDSKADPISKLLECPNGRASTIGDLSLPGFEGRPQVMIPDQKKSENNEQLQLEWFVFQQQGIWYIHCKPAVYLYPQQKQLVNVKVFPKGELSYTDPPYDKKTGWTIQADPQGFLSTLNFEAIPQGYLYYESKLLDSEIKHPQTGWVVRQTELAALFNRVLPQLGLNAKEQADFENYWLHKLPNSPYYFVGLVDKNQRDYLEPLEVTPNPDTSIRFSLFFEPLVQTKQVVAPILKPPVRTGFTLVDWGGMIKLHPGTPFTCSQ